MPRPFSIVIHARTGERRKYPINRESNSPDTPRNPINFPSPALFPPISTVFTTREHNLSCCFRINFTQSFADSLLNSFKVNILRDAIKNSKRFAWFPLPFFFFSFLFFRKTFDEFLENSLLIFAFLTFFRSNSKFLKF